MGVITYNGTASTNFKIKVEKFPDYEVPQRVVESFEVPGRNGNLLIDYGYYKNHKQTYEIYYNAKTNGFWADTRAIAKWLNTDGYKRLTDSYDPTVYRMARVSKIPTFKDFWGIMGRTEVEFDCKPQRFLLTGESSVSLTSGTPVTNSYMPAKPLLTVTGNGTVTINGYSFTVTNNSGTTITVDCELMDAYTGSTNRNEDISGDFPVLDNGSNAVTYDVTSVTMIPRWWTL